MSGLVAAAAAVAVLGLPPAHAVGSEPPALAQVGGSYGNGTGEFSWAVDVAFGPGGIIAVADMFNDRVQVFHPNGTFAYQIGGNGSGWRGSGEGPGEFNMPNGVAFGPGGIMAVVDAGNYRVQVFHPNGTFAYQVGQTGRLFVMDFEELGGGVAFGPGGIMAVANKKGVQVFHPNGTFAYEEPHGWTFGVAFGPGGIIASAGMSGVTVFHPNGTFAYMLGGTGPGRNGEGSGPGEFDATSGVAFGPGGIIAVSDAYNHRVQVFHPNGTFAYQIGGNGSGWRGVGNGPGELDRPGGVAFGPGGIIAVANKNGVQVFHPPPARLAAPPVAPSRNLSLAGAAYAFEFGSLGSGAGQFMAARDVAIGPNGIMAVADTYNHRVQVFHPNGTFAFQFGSPGVGRGEFVWPGGVAFGPSGIMAVADTGNHRVQVFHPDGTYAFELGVLGAGPGEFHRPEGLAFGPGGTLVVSDMSNTRVQVFQLQSAAVVALGLPPAHAIGSEPPAFAYQVGSSGSTPGEFDYPRGVAFGPSGIMAVVERDNHRVQVFHPNGTFAFQFGSEGRVSSELRYPFDIAFGPGGIMAVSDRGNEHVYVFHANGTYDYRLGWDESGPGEFDYPDGLAFGPGGIMAVADTGNINNRIQVFHPNGTYAYHFGSRGSGPGEFHYPHDVAFGPGGIMAVADHSNQRVQVFHPNGTFAFQFGSRGSGPGEFGADRGDRRDYYGYHGPEKIAFGPGGIMAVADYYNHRVQMFHPNGTFAYQFGSYGSGPGEFSWPSGLAFGPGGIIAVADPGNDRVQVFRPPPPPPVVAPPAAPLRNQSFTGAAHAFEFGSLGSGAGQFMAARDVAIGPGGIIAVADTFNRRVQMFHPNGTFAFEFGSPGVGPGEFAWPSGIAFGPGGIMAVADTGNHRVQVFHPHGTFAFALGALGAGPSEFYYPKGLTFGPGGTLAVSDMGNARVQVFRLQ